MGLTNLLSPENIDSLNWAKSKELTLNNEPLLPIVVQHYITLEVLMLGYVSQESLASTFQKHLLTFYSRNRQQLWTKGETSGNYLKFVKAFYDCDKDSLVAFVLPQGPTCHTGSETCFQSEQNSVEKSNLKFGTHASGSSHSITGSEKIAQAGFLPELIDLIKTRHAQQNENSNSNNSNNSKVTVESKLSYTQALFENGFDKCIQKVGEEAVEVLIAAKNLNSGSEDIQKQESLTDEFIGESADLLFHWLVVCEYLNVSPKRVLEKLSSRRKLNHEKSSIAGN